MIISIVVFILVLLLIVSEKIDRSIIGILGALTLVFTKVITFEEMIEYIDFEVIGLLMGMMIIVYIVSKTGIFEYLAIKSVQITKGRPMRLLMMLMVITAVLSAFLDNVTTIILMIPVTLFISKILKITPLPFIISQIAFSNIGGASTIIGDPPNIIIATQANIDFINFSYNMLPAVLLSSFFTMTYFYLVFKKKINQRIIKFSEIKKIKTENAIRDIDLLKKSIFILAIVLLGFFTHSLTHFEPALIALFGAFFLILITKYKAEEIYKKIEWKTLFFFMGLFVVIGGLEKTGVLNLIGLFFKNLVGNNVLITNISLLLFAGFTSGFIDNIPITILISEIIKTSALDKLSFLVWYALALGADFGGNMTLIGASANVVASDIYNRSENNEEKITFLNFLKYGLPVFFISMISSIGYLFFRMFILK